ncbi:MAG: SCO family protein [Chitinophagaceae bacterium]
MIPIFSLLICTSVIWKWTYGFSAFTIFSYTLKSAGSTPRDFPEMKFISQDEKIFELKEKKKYVLVNFVYLNCPYVCHKVNNQIEEIYHLFDSTMVPSQLEFLTISFDLKNDDLVKIKRYRERFGTDINGWSFALPYQSDQKTFNRFLIQAGIWKYQIPASGIINHSVYLLLINPKNKIVKIFDPARENSQAITSQIKSCVKN